VAKDKATTPAVQYEQGIYFTHLGTLNKKGHLQFFKINFQYHLSILFDRGVLYTRLYSMYCKIATPPFIFNLELAFCLPVFN
jgi:hypothetical protein